MSQDHIQALVALFGSSLGAGDALASLRDSGVVNVTTVQNAAILRADAAGKLHVFLTADRSGRNGALIGGVAGGIVGLLGSAVAPPPALRTVLGGLAADLRTAGFTSTRLAALTAWVQPGYSLLIVAVADGTAAEAMLQGAGATVVRERLDRQLAAALDMAAHVLTSAVDPRFDSGANHSSYRPAMGSGVSRVPVSPGSGG